MFAHILKYDLLLLWRSRFIQLLVGLLLLLSLPAFYAGKKHFDRKKETIQQIITEQQNNNHTLESSLKDIERTGVYNGSSWTDPRQPLAVGNKLGIQNAWFAPSALSILQGGQSDYYPYYYQVTLSKKQGLYHSDEVHNPLLLFVGNFDVTYIIIFFLPLIIISMTFNLVARPSEEGFASLLVSSSYRIAHVIFLQWLWRLLLFTVLTVTVFTCYALLFGVLGDAGIKPWVSFLGWTILYILFWFGLCLLAASWKLSSGATAAILIGSWLVLLIFTPALLGQFIKSRYPAPSRLTWITEMRNASDQANREKAANMAKYLEDHPEFNGNKNIADDYAATAVISQMKTDQAVEPIEKKYRQIFNEQQMLANRFRILSPALVMQEHFQDITHTGDVYYRNFEGQIDNYHKTYRKFFYNKILKSEKFKATDIEQIPVFSFDSNNNSKASDFDAAILLLLSLIILSGAYFNLSKKGLAINNGGLVRFSEKRSSLVD